MNYIISIEIEVCDSCFGCSHAQSIKNSKSDYCTIFKEYINYNGEPCPDCRTAQEKCK